jgi:hypothetical protein
MEARLAVVWFICSDEKVRQVALTPKQIQKLEGYIKQNIMGGTLKLIEKPINIERAK